MREALIIDVCTCRPAERTASHGRRYHLYAQICRALERTAAAQLDYILATLYHTLPERLPVGIGETLCAYYLVKRARGRPPAW